MNITHNDMRFAINPDLIQRAQQGDATVVGLIYELYHLSVFRYLYYRVGDHHTAEDLTSEVFLRMIHNLRNFRPLSVSFQAWIFQIARNLAIDHYRENKVRNHVQLEENLATNTENIDKNVEHTINCEYLNQALSELPEDQRDVILLRFVSGMPIAHVAQTLHKSEDSIKGLQRRGLLALRQILSKWEVSYV